MIQPVATVISSGEVSADTVDFVNSTNEGLTSSDTEIYKRNSSYVDTYLDPAFMSLMKDSDQRRQEQWEKTAQAPRDENSGVFEEYESSSYEKLVSPIDAHPSKVVQAVMKSFFAKIYKR
ncbi:hypothetical protein V6N11_058793 [Hibiscus sabdariffa]|uniref:Uncharacterized protein n=1 Tax=Hibiscus sabdariffa TaxID=183260 RepID=A0ABR2U644_9ROSI